MLLRAVLTLLPLVTWASHAMAAPQSCEHLTQLRLPDTTITLAVSTAGTFTPPAGNPLEGLPAFCRVVGVIRPTSDSHIEFEVWMPAAGWNGRFYGLGNPGAGGEIQYVQIAQAVRRGYAVASTDTGHKGGITDVSWTLAARGESAA